MFEDLLYGISAAEFSEVGWQDIAVHAELCPVTSNMLTVGIQENWMLRRW